MFDRLLLSTVPQMDACRNCRTLCTMPLCSLFMLRYKRFVKDHRNADCFIDRHVIRVCVCVLEGRVGPRACLSLIGELLPWRILDTSDQSDDVIFVHLPNFKLKLVRYKAHKWLILGNGICV